jgi:hypothetical protein
LIEIHRRSLRSYRFIPVADIACIAAAMHSPQRLIQFDPRGAMTTMRALLFTMGMSVGSLVCADEGMWPFDNVPTAAIKLQLGVAIDQAWLDKVRTSTVRLPGCTASFVSPDGLLLTNQHCIASCLSNLSTPQKNLLADGFLAANRAGERQCPAQLADVLMGMEDVTAKVNAATRGLNEQAANEQRKKILTQLEQTCEDASAKNKDSGALKCESVTLYNGGQYFIYKYKRYTDVRLAFAPEQGVAAFGGDPDNFQFPRWCLDMALLRVYDNGKPIAAPNHMRINFAGPAAGDPVFVSGHPGSTERLLTVSQLEARRASAPQWLLRASELRGRYIQFGKQDEESLRIVQDPLNNLENGIKVRRKQLDALLNEKLLEQKSRGENALRSAVTASGDLASRTGDPWGEIERATRAFDAFEMPYTFIESGAGFNGRLFGYARALVRGTAEREKPNTDRLPEFADARLPRLAQQINAGIPVYPQLEKLSLSFSLERMREWLGPDHPIVRQLLSKDSPDSLAAKLVDGTQLADPSVRAALWKEGVAGINASTDPMIVLARSIDADARALRKRYEDEVEAPVRAATERIAAARFAVFGTRVYPDATFTLRLNYGTVQGWKEGGHDIAPFTYLERMFERATGAEPFRVPESWLKAKSQLDLKTPFNLVSNTDIIGGNSGSPLVNAKGEVVGLLFDGNIHAISGAYWFDAEKNRSVSVHPAIMREALQKVYRAEALLKELQGR